MKRLWRRAADRLPAALVAPLMLVAVAGVIAVLVLDGSGSEPEEELERGAELFSTEFTPEQGLGPLFNETGCAGCHLEPAVGGVGREGLATVLRIGRLTEAGFGPMLRRGGPFGHKHAVSELGADCDRLAGIPAGANVTSVRNTPPLFGSGLIDGIPEEVIRAGARRGGGETISGRPNLVPGPGGTRRVGRFGWKADVASLQEFVAAALRNELGLTSALAPGSPPPAGAEPCPGETGEPEVDEDMIAAMTAFVGALPAPEPERAEPTGAAVFEDVGCAACHTPALEGSTGDVPLYSDLLLHDMGPALDDRVIQERAIGSEWRTAPLWGLGDRSRYLHDGRAESIAAAILAHGGEAEAARERFRSLSRTERARLIAFLRTR